MDISPVPGGATEPQRQVVQGRGKVIAEFPDIHHEKK